MLELLISLALINALLMIIGIAYVAKCKRRNINPEPMAIDNLMYSIFVEFALVGVILLTIAEFWNWRFW